MDPKSEDPEEQPIQNLVKGEVEYAKFNEEETVLVTETVKVVKKAD